MQFQFSKFLIWEFLGITVGLESNVGIERKWGRTRFLIDRAFSENWCEIYNKILKRAGLLSRLARGLPFTNILIFCAGVGVCGIKTFVVLLIEVKWKSWNGHWSTTETIIEQWTISVSNTISENESITTQYTTTTTNASKQFIAHSSGGAALRKCTSFYICHLRSYWADPRQSDRTANTWPCRLHWRWIMHLFLRPFTISGTPYSGCRCESAYEIFSRI